MTTNTIGWYSEKHAEENGSRQICLTLTNEYEAVSYLASSDQDPHINSSFSDWKKIGPIRHITCHENLNNGKWMHIAFCKEKRAANKVYTGIYREK
jgi:hypothetical protein